MNPFTLARSCCRPWRRSSCRPQPLPTCAPAVFLLPALILFLPSPHPCVSLQVDAWVDFASHDVELPATLWVYPILGWSKYNDAVHAKAVEDLHAALATLERHLLSRTFVVGEAVTLADIVLVAALFYPFKLVLDGSVREAYPSVTRWFYTCVNQPAFAAVLGDVPLCHEALVASGGSADAAAKAVKGAAAAGGAGKAEAKPKAEKKAAEPKAEKPKAAKAEKAEEDSGMPDIPKEVKAKNPLELLPKSAFNLDEWKRHYSNTKPHIEAMPWFWEKMDREGWSLWKQDYNYDAENTRDYASEFNDRGCGCGCGCGYQRANLLFRCSTATSQHDPSLPSHRHPQPPTWWAASSSARRRCAAGPSARCTC